MLHILEHFGYELDLGKISDEEKEEIKQQIAFVKENRELITKGTFYRLLSPFEGDETSWMVVSKDKKKAIVGYYRERQPSNAPYKRLYLKGLDDQTQYRINEDENLYYGDELMYAGMIISDQACGVRSANIIQGDYQSRIFILSEA